MSFDQDLFISYAHLDNKPLPPDEVGWISRFHESLKAFVSMRLGGKVKIWRDDSLRGNDVFSDEIVDQFKKTAILISILTPRYIQSDWCSRELREFCNAAKQTGGVVIDNKSRVIKVIKTPVASQEGLPEVAQDVLGYQFYTMSDGDVPLELDPAYGEEYAQAYNRKIGELAWDIKELLVKLRANGSAPSGVRQKQLPKVYLAECGYDRIQERERIGSELKTLGYDVVPRSLIPKDEASHVSAVKELMQDCRLSIHLVGTTYGAIPDGPSRKSGVVIQNEIAAEFSNTKGLKRLIWLPAGTEAEDPDQQNFITALHNDEKVQFGADLISGDFEHLRAAVHATLERLQAPDTPEVKDTKLQQLVYLICTESDRKATVNLRKHLRKQGIDVEMPAFSGDAEVVRKTNERLLAGCDGVVVFYGAGDEAWKRSVDFDLKKVFAYRQGRPLKAQFTYLADPPNDDKEDLVDMEEENLIVSYGQFDRQRMGALFECLEQ